MSLHISPALDLPVDAVTETFAILAKRGAGKSNAAVVMAEEMYDNGLPWVAIDPKGDWWGVRAAGDGKAPGLAVLVFGGLHGDVPLEPTAGRLVADLVVEQRLTCVLDVSEMTKADQRRFLIDFADRLYRRNTEPLHVFCEEADEYIPQRVMGENAKLVGTFETLVKRGRTHGLGVTLITQRSASLNKDVLTQIETLIPMRTPSPQDRKAILAWVDVHDAGRDTVDALPGLASGEAFVFSPQWLDLLVRIKFRRRRTFDSGATPKVGGKPRPPATLAEVDLAAIKEQMADTIERAKADDPKELRKQIRDLQHEIDRMAVEPLPVERVEVRAPVVSDEDRAALASLCGHMVGLHQSLITLVTRFEEIYQLPAAAKEGSGRTSAAVAQPRRPTAPGSTTPGTATPGKKPAGARDSRADAPAGQLGKAERAVLTVLAQHDARTKVQVAVLTGYSHRGGGFNNALGALRSRGLIEGRDVLTVTDAGRDELGDYEPLPTGQALIDHWASRLGRAERLILEVLVEAWPATLTKDEIADATGYAASGGGFNNALGKLRGLELIEGRTDIAACEALGGAR